MRTMRGETPRFIVLGTDTDVGKTFVSAALCRGLARAGHVVAACKPVETGGAQPSDLDTLGLLCAEFGGAVRLHRGLRFARAAAPSAAAAAEHRAPPTADDCAAAVREAESGADAVVVETCGGALTPLSDREYVADIVARLDGYAPVLVAGLRLGVLSHAFGAFEYLRSRGLPVPAVVLNDRFAPSEPWYVDATRADMRARGLAVAAYIPHGAGIDDVDLLHALAGSAVR